MAKQEAEAGPQEGSTQGGSEGSGRPGLTWVPAAHQQGPSHVLPLL